MLEATFFLGSLYDNALFGVCNLLVIMKVSFDGSELLGTLPFEIERMRGRSFIVQPLVNFNKIVLNFWG